MGLLVIGGLASPHPLQPTPGPSAAVISKVGRFTQKRNAKARTKGAKPATVPDSGIPARPDSVIGTVGVVEPVGKLKITRNGAKLPTLADLGMPIHFGDSLTLKAPGTAFVKCSDDRTLELRVGPQSCPCSTKPSPDLFDNVRIPRTSRTKRDDIPIIISPRATSLMNPRPTVRWASIAGATKRTTYEVSIYGEGMKLMWKEQVSGKTELPYPTNKKALIPGEYIVIVETDGHISTDEPQKGLGFVLLDRQKAREVFRAKERLRKLRLAEPPMRVFLAILYSRRGLYAGAIEQLQSLPEAAKTPTVARMLGALYLTIGLTSEAEEIYAAVEQRYESELNNPQGTPLLTEDLEGQALIKIALARLYDAQDKSGAKTKLQEAIRIYEKLGDSAAIEVAREWLSKLPDARK